MKDIYAYGEKTARNGGKMVIYESQILRLTLYVMISGGFVIPAVQNKSLNDST